MIQPIIVLYFEFETGLKFINLEARLYFYSLKIEVVVHMSNMLIYKLCLSQRAGYS